MLQIVTGFVGVFFLSNMENSYFSSFLSPGEEDSEDHETVKVIVETVLFQTPSLGTLLMFPYELQRLL